MRHLIAAAAVALVAACVAGGAPAGANAGGPAAAGAGAVAAAPAGARIARVWRGRTAAARADEYAEYLAAALPKFRSIPGNVGYTMLREDGPEESHFMVVSWWTSAEAIRGYAGEDISRTRFLPRDREFLIEPEAYVRNYRVERVDPAP